MRFRGFAGLVAILLIAAGIRLHDLTGRACNLDESWAIEIATGRGSLHQHLPSNRLLPAPGFFSLNDAPPVWRIWSNMQVTHPPLYSIALRCWEMLLGDSDENDRLLSVIASLVAIGLLFDTVRLQGGLVPAGWAAMLMAVSVPQLEHARLARSYAMLTALALLIANAAVRIDLGISLRRNGTILFLATLTTLLTHYFCAGALIGLGAWALLLSRPARNRIILTLLLAGLSFAIIWGPFLWQQRAMFSTEDPSTLFLTSHQPHHLQTTLIRLGIAPLSMLFPIGPLMLIPAIGFGLVLPLLPIRILRNRPALVMWCCWLLGSLLLIAGMDLARRTDHLYFIRYILLAGPAVYALVPLLACGYRSWLCHVVCAGLTVMCLFNLPGAYAPVPGDPRQLVRDLIARPGAADLLIVAAEPGRVLDAEDELLCVSRYLQPLPCRVMILTHPPDRELLEEARRARLVFLLTERGPEPDFPDAKVLSGRSYPQLGNVFTLTINPTP
jgi:hypothetical protein